MQQMRFSLFYNLQDVIRKSDFHRKYDLLFQSLDLSAVRDTNTGIGRTGYSRHAMLRAFIVKHLEGIKSVPRLIEFLDTHPVLPHFPLSGAPLSPRRINAPVLQNI